VSVGDETSVEASRLILQAQQVGIVLRALGSVGVGLHCGPSQEAMAIRQRQPKDIDLATRKQDRRELRRFFEAEGYEVDRDMLVAMEGTRYLFRNRSRLIDVDVWVDVLDLCHRLDVSDRLGMGPTLSIEDLVLSKLQIVELTPGDLEDLTTMVTVHGLSGEPGERDDPEVIDVDYLTGILGDDWGFWRTALGNLEKLNEHVGAEARTNVQKLIDLVNDSPKTIRWKLRARIGERVQWWQDVDIPRDTY
jgi:hypothetical protein